MSDYVFKVAGRHKIDGKEYKDGDMFPYDPENPRHKVFLELNWLKIEVKKAATRKRKTS